MPTVTLKRFAPQKPQETPDGLTDFTRTLSDFPVPDELIARQPVRHKGRQSSSPATLFINYPRRDKTKLPVGTTKIDISTGTVFLADGTTEEMYSARPIESCRSLLMYVDQTVEIRLERDGTPATYLRYNLADDLVSVKKVIDGITYRRNIIDPDVVDTTVDKWVEYGEWEAL